MDDATFDLSKYDYFFSISRFEDDCRNKWMEEKKIGIYERLWAKSADGWKVVKLTTNGMGLICQNPNSCSFLMVEPEWCERREKETKLTPRQWALYRFLLDADGTSTQYMAYCNYPSSCHKDGYKWVDSPKHGDHCREIWDDIKAINASPEVDKVIIAKDYLYKLGDEEDVDGMIDYLEKKIALLGARRSALMLKKRQDGQGKLINNQGRPMGAGSKPYHESYKKEELNND